MPAGAIFFPETTVSPQDMQKQHSHMTESFAFSKQAGQFDIGWRYAAPYFLLSGLTLRALPLRLSAIL